ncbi:hypothetical protein [Alicyclobacillus cycloheptanicus]|uniref:Thiosulfate dehydrogenase [quinone] large subunit n=1 Tax=Alicyclobacillus cycloheptanicus TaxID=1457 RepID=A0ABT9XIX5_9BACL|nr:hypothetical protein [Alicyclobacillus cycloheptanicus]MDQ0190269.1 thiosulfate dehydrogenase [quinone] large subunit [Alicyclobacillus cycloheptanicus]
MNEGILYKRVFTPILMICIAYEWLVSGLDKVMSGDFVQQLKGQLSSSLGGMQYHFYENILKSFVIPHAMTFAVLVEVGEICAGIGFVLLAVALFRNRVGAVAVQLGIWVPLVSAFMALNFFLWQGGSVFINPGDPFDEGITIDLMLVLIQVWIAIFFFMTGRASTTRFR